MAYKRYIKKGGKVYGPYVYHSHKKDGKVISEYLGKHEPLKKKENPIERKLFTFLLIGLILVMGIVVMKSLFIERVLLAPEERFVLLTETNYLVGEQITGSVKINLQRGELIPINTKVLINNVGQNNEFFLSDLVSQEKVLGDFYLEGYNLVGNGSGYGIIGEKITYSEVSFVMQIQSLDKTSKDKPTSSGGGGSEPPSEEPQEETPPEGAPTENITEIPEENVTETPEEPSVEESEEEVVEEPVEETTEEETPIEPPVEEPPAEEVVEEPPVEEPPQESPQEVIVKEVVRGDSSFTYRLGENETARILSSSEPVEIIIENGIVTITTNYSESEAGFGMEYLGEEILSLEFDLEQFRFVAESGEFSVGLIYDELEMLSASEQIFVGEEIREENITLPEVNVTLPKVNVSSNVSSLIQSSAVIGQPVVWKQIVKSETVKELRIKIPKQSKNIKVRITKERVKDGSESQDAPVVTLPPQTNFTNATIINKTNETQIIVNETNSTVPGITGNAVTEIPPESVITNDLIDSIEVVLDGQELEYEIEYETPAPYTEESDIPNGKSVKVVGIEGIHYTNVLAFTNLPETFNLRNPSRVKIHWIEQNSFLQPVSVQDLDSNGIFDYVEWIVPTLSNQTFNIIVITNAEHLDSNLSFISDITDEVIKLDDVWSEIIPDGDYVRITFEIPLTSDRDITIYPRIVNGTPTIEVYEQNQNTLIAEFTDLIDNQYNKVFLNNLISESQDVFDLRILGGSVEFDHIIDPYVEKIFEDCSDLSDWVIVSGDSNLWKVGTGGDSGWCIASNVDSKTNMTSSTIDLSDSVSANLSFDRSNINLDPGEYLRVYVNSSVDYFTLLLDTLDNNLVTESFNLSEFITLNAGVHIQFECFNTANNEDCRVGNINITSFVPPGKLNPTLVVPVDDETVVQNDTFTINATVICVVNNCGTVKGTARYNASSSVPDASVDVNPGGFPFVVTSPATATSYTQQASFTTAGAGGALKTGITSNGISLWVLDLSGATVFHYSVEGVYLPSGNIVSEMVNPSLQGIVTNGSDFWVVDNTDDFVYHFDRLGNNLTDGFPIGVAGANNPKGITTDGSDFWITDSDDDFVYHFNSAGQNQTDGFNVLSAGASWVHGITTNGSDFWIVDSTDDYLYHFDSQGNNLTDGFKLDGTAAPLGLTSELVFPRDLPGSSPLNFWIQGGAGENYVSHFERLSGNPQSCGNLNQNDYCELIWEVNATGAGSYEIDVNFGSDNVLVVSNDTLDSTLSISSESGCSPSPGENLFINTTFTCTNKIWELASLNVSSIGSVTLNDVTLIVGETIVQPGGYLEIKDSPNTIWQNGNLTISGTYVLDNTVLKMNGTNDGSVGINVTSTGNMTIRNGANITNGYVQTANYFFTVLSGADFRMVDSFLDKAGWAFGFSRSGLVLNTTGALVQNNTITDSYILLAIYGDSNTIIDNNFSLRGIDGNLLVLEEEAFNNSISNNYFSYLQQTTLRTAIIFRGGSYNNSFFSNNITHISGMSGRIIELSGGAHHNTLHSNFIYDPDIDDAGTMGILVDTSNNSIYSNVVGINAIFSYGLVILGSDNLIYFNNVTINQINSRGVWLFGGDSNQIFSNKIVALKSGSNAIYLQGTTISNNFTDNIFNVSSTYAIELTAGAIDNVFTNTIITNFSSGIHSTGGAYNNSIVNGTFNISKVTFGGATDNLTIKWFSKVNVTSVIGNPIPGVLVNISDVNGKLEFSGMTNLNGLTNWSVVTDRIMRQSGDVSFNDHKINGTKSGFFPNEDLVNLNKTTITNLILSLEFPTIDFVSPTPVDGFLGGNSAYINVSVNSSVLNLTAFIDWNRSLVGWWRFNEGSGLDVNDFSSYGNDATLKNGTAGGPKPTWSKGKFGSGVKFDKGLSFVHVPNNQSFNVTNFTLEVWIKINSFAESPFSTIIKKDFQYILRFTRNDGCLYAYVWNPGISLLVSNNCSLDSRWHHIALTYNGTNRIIYIDGVLDQMDYRVGGIAFSSEDIGIGGRPINLGDETFNGSIDEVKIWNRALSPEEINASFNAGIHRLSRNFTNLAGGTYDYIAYVQDIDGNVNQTETRNFTVDATNPLIEFVNPTRYDGGATNKNYARINIAVTESNMGDITYNWNGTNYTFYDDSLIFMMNFNNVSSLGENDTHMVDASISGNDGDCTGISCPKWISSGKYGGAFIFDGSDGIINISGFSGNPGLNSYSIEFWQKRGEIGAIRTISKGFWDNELSQTTGWWFRVDGNLKTTYISVGDGITTKFAEEIPGDASNDSKWHHFVGVIDRDLQKLRLYRDGVLMGIENDLISVGPISSTNNLIIGAGQNSSGNLVEHFNGTIDEVRIWNKSLNGSEVAQLYRMNLQKYDIDKWNMDINQSIPKNGTYTYYGKVDDNAGNTNQTETRTLIVHRIPPDINFIFPTDNKGAFVTRTSSFVNVSISSQLSNLTGFIDWNRSLRAWYRFEEGSGALIQDSSGWGNDCDASVGASVPSRVPGKFGEGMDFDGVNWSNQANCGSDLSLNMTYEITVEAWVKTNNDSNYGRIVNGNFASPNSWGLLQIPSPSDWRFVLVTGTQQKVARSDNGVYESTVGKWTHLVGTYNGTWRNLYVNGVLQNHVNDDPRSNFNDPLTNALPVAISLADDSNHGFNGSIDEIKIWNRVLSIEEINASYNAGVYRLSLNLTNLAEGIYEYTAYIQDIAGNLNQTETRTVGIDLVNPLIQFEIPTPNNNSIISNNYVGINISAVETNVEEFTYNWNGTNYTFYDNSLVFMMNFNNNSALGENSTYMVDGSMYKHNANCTVPFCPEWNVTGRYGGGFEFDGLYDHIYGGNDLSLNITNAITLSAWIRYENSTGYIISKGDDATSYNLYSPAGAKNRIVFLVRTTPTFSLATVSAYNDSEWHHVVGTYDKDVGGNNLFLYVDGVEVNSTAGFNPIRQGGAGLEIGGFADSGGFVWNGSIDEVMIWNRSLSANEVQQLYNSNLYKYDIDTLGLYVNQSNLVSGTYTYYGYLEELTGSSNMTEIRTLTVDRTPPNISFVFPTDDNGIFANKNSSFVNVSVSDLVSPNNLTAFIDWNRSLVGWWRFNEGSGLLVNDFSTYGNDGVLGNGSIGTKPSWTSAGKFGGALEFKGNGSDNIADFVEIPNDLSFAFGNGSYTIEAWIKFNASGTTGTIFRTADQNQRVFLETRVGGDDGRIWFGAQPDFGGGGSARSSRRLNDNIWHHVVGTRDGIDGQLRVYIDGTRDGTGNIVPGNITALENPRIGTRPTTGREFFNGTIDEVKVWNRLLSLEEINASFNAGINRLYRNFTNLSEGIYEYTAYVQDLSGNVNQTETRILGIDWFLPLIQFANPTLPNNTIIGMNWTEINISATEVNLGKFTYNWNGTNYTFYDDSLIFMMNFNNVSSLGENDTHMVDVSRYRAFGNCYGTRCPNWTASGKYGGGYHFEGNTGNNDFINISTSDGQPLNIYGDRFTISTWFISPDFAGNQQARLVSRLRPPWGNKNNMWTFGLSYLDASTCTGDEVTLRLRMISDDAANASEFLADCNLGILTDNEWQHGVVVYNSTNVLFYLNGVRVNGVSATKTGNVHVETDGTSWIGDAGPATYRPFYGTIDEVMIWNKSLNASEVQQLYSISLQKHDIDKWSLYVNQSIPQNGTYTYYGYVQELTGSSNMTDIRTIIVNTPPVITSVKLNATSTFNSSADDLNVYYTGGDTDANLRTNITDWRVNGTSIAILNMPFDTNISSATSGIIRDYSTFGNNGTLGGGVQANAPVWAYAGKVGGAYEFDGVDDFINLTQRDGTPLEIVGNEMTISAWFKLNEVGSDSRIVSKAFGQGEQDHYWMLSVRDGSDDNLRFRLKTDVGGTSVVFGSSNLLLDEWTYATAVYNGTNMLIYTNGILEGNLLKTGNIVEDSSVQSWIGASPENGAPPFSPINGSIDELKIYNYSLSPEQIIAEYQAGLAGHNVEKIVSQETSAGENWSVAVTPNDIFSDGDTILSNDINITAFVNTLPTVTLDSPPNNNVTSVRDPTFSWTGFDAEFDSMTYEINITYVYVSGAGGICDVNRTENVGTDTSYTPFPYLGCLVDTGWYYLWSVRANDGTEWGPWASSYKINITAFVTINLTIDSVAFGSMLPDQNNDTLDNSPFPFILENTGNVFVNVSVNATNLWESLGNENPTQFFRYKVDFNESNSFDPSLSQMAWKDVPSSSLLEVVIANFNWSNPTDSAEIDLNVTVPGVGEGIGTRRSWIQFSARLNE